MVKVISDPRYKLNKKKIKSDASKHLNQIGLGDQYLLNVIFVGTRKMIQISANYKNEKRALPVLSFSYLERKNKSLEINEENAKEKLIGEIFLCYPQIVLLAAERQKRVEDMVKELVEHGIDTICST